MSGTSLTAPRSVVWSAFRAGGLASFLVRPGRSGAALVAECTFSRYSSALAFARRWSGRVGRSVAVRRAGGGWSVVVPVAWSSSRLPAGICFRWPVAGGGLRQFAALVSSCGLV